MIEHIQNNINNRQTGKVSAVFYASRPSHILSYIPLSNLMNLRGHVSYIIHPIRLDSYFKEIDTLNSNLVNISLNEIYKLKNIDIFFTNELYTKDPPRNSSSCAIYHSLPESLKFNYGTNLMLKPNVAKVFDYYLIAVKQKNEHWKEDNYSAIQNLYPSVFLDERRQYLDIIPGGYIKLDYLSQVIDPDCEKDCIIYAPTASTYHKASEIEQYGANIINELINNYPQYHIVFRPYPKTDPKIVKKISEQYTSSSQFILDSSLTGLKYQKRAKTIVTDMSSFATTFSLATGIPTLFINVKKRILKENIYGLFVNDINEMIDAINYILNNINEFKNKILKVRESYIYNPCRASEYVVDNIKLIADKKSHKEWLSVPRTPLLIERSIDIQNHLSKLLHQSQDGKNHRYLMKKTHDEIYEYFENIDL